MKKVKIVLILSTLILITLLVLYIKQTIDKKEPAVSKREQFQKEYQLKEDTDENPK